MVFARDARRRHEEASLPLWTTRGLFFRHVVFRLRRRLECIYQVQVILRDEIEWNGRHPCGRWTATCWLTCDSFHPRRVVFHLDSWNRFLRHYIYTLLLYGTLVNAHRKKLARDPGIGNRSTNSRKNSRAVSHFPTIQNMHSSRNTEAFHDPTCSTKKKELESH